MGNIRQFMRCRDRHGTSNCGCHNPDQHYRKPTCSISRHANPFVHSTSSLSELHRNKRVSGIIMINTNTKKTMPE